VNSLECNVSRGEDHNVLCAHDCPHTLTQQYLEEETGYNRGLQDNAMHT
jgi:hypothetical protein